MHFFDELGSLIEQQWRAHNYSEEVFPALAAQALAEAAPCKHVSPWEVIRWLFNTAHFPNQADIPGRFGNPPITLYSGSRFHIDIYYWLDGTTAIHQHAFCGAFQVLVGSSILSHYSFKPGQMINEHFIVGQINQESVELLEQGSIKEILPGKHYIHSLFHLDRPSATICVRTYHTVSGEPQYAYVKPYFAVDPFFSDPLTIKQKQSASLLLSLQHPEAVEMIGDLLSRSDFQTAFAVLDLARNHLRGNAVEKAFGLTIGEEQYQALLETTRRRHGQLVDLLQPVFEEVERQNNLIDRRGQITGGEHRFFLALLLNVPRRETLLKMVKQRFPDCDPVETITNWVDELANMKVMGSIEPNVLGIHGFGEDYLLVLQCMLEGLSIEATRSAFEKEFSADYLASLGDKPEELYSAVRESLLFKAIFLDLPGSTG